MSDLSPAQAAIARARAIAARQHPEVAARILGRPMPQPTVPQPTAQPRHVVEAVATPEPAQPEAPFTKPRVDYTDLQKARIVRRAADLWAQGEIKADIARAVGIPFGTLLSWMRANRSLFPQRTRGGRRV